MQAQGDTNAEPISNSKPAELPFNAKEVTAFLKQCERLLAFIGELLNMMMLQLGQAFWSRLATRATYLLVCLSHQEVQLDRKGRF